MTNTRLEQDSMGELEVPADAQYAAQTQRAVNNFPVSGRRMPKSFIKALLQVKAPAAKANVELEQIPESIGVNIGPAGNRDARGNNACRNGQVGLDLHRCCSSDYTGKYHLEQHIKLDQFIESMGDREAAFDKALDEGVINEEQADVVEFMFNDAPQLDAETANRMEDEVTRSISYSAAIGGYPIVDSTNLGSTHYGQNMFVDNEDGTGCRAIVD